MNQKKYTKSGLFIAFIAMLSFSTNTFAQQLGIYTFTGHTCAAPLTAVSAQPANAVFSDYSLTGATCTAAAAVYNSNGWTLGAALDPTKYFEFTITPNACTVMNLDSLKFLHRVSSSAGAVTVVLRSSLDGFTADLHNAPITAINSNVNLGIDLPASFNGLTSAVTFRTYVVNILSAGATYRHDNVELIGTATAYPLADYYQDLDGDGFGNAAVFVNTCTPVGYVANADDCDDNNNLVGAGNIYYQDFDTDGFGNAAITQTACTQPVGYVTNDDDCDDNNNLVGVATTVYYQDFDTDGFGNAAVTQTACTQPVGYVSNDDDCDDNNNLVGVATTVFYADTDNDTYGDGGSTIIACTQPVGYVSNGDDCDDNNNAIHPGATETCDGIDNNCVGGIDDNVVSQTWYLDSDTDGFGNPAVSQSNCAQPVGYVLNDDDCDDNDNLVGVATTVYYADADTDGFGDAAIDSVACTQPAGYVSNADDCDDSDNLIGAGLSYYPDVDSDTYGDANASATVACTPPANYVTDNTDCNDANPNQYPGATEIPNNSVDEDCNGSDLNTLGSQLAQYVFTGNLCATPVLGVTAQPANALFSDYLASDSLTCAAGNNIINYSNWNTAATLDLAKYYEFTVTPDNCYELSLTQLTFLHRVSNTGGTPFVHVRSSLDNFASDVFTTQITAPGTDFIETVPLTGPFASIQGPVSFRFYVVSMGTSGATYRNDNVSLTGFINALPLQTYYADADNDGFGNPAVDSMDCAAPAGYVTDNTDCNDNDANENPNAVWFQDLDNDTFGNSAVTLTQCTQPVGYVDNNSDCDDTDDNIGGSITYYEDADNDTYGNSASTTQACTQPVGYVLNANDCDDSNSAITIATDEFYIDLDSDGFGSTAVTIVACTQPAGYVSNADDCDDNDDSITLGSTFYEDGDNDSFGNPNSTIVDCTAPNGYVADSTDCDDTNNAINPNGTDVLGNSIDENCDGTDGNLGLTDAAIATFNVFPNPGTSAVTITLNGSWDQQVTVTILSVDGKTVQTSTGSSNGAVTVATTQLLPSVYFIRVNDGTHTSVARWVKQ
ncbi:MAG: hypothetical protein A3D31_14840 [Candidatus Fluviicola riflensis]|nr:MAG: hypothetical protein A3D31_14840 [Candidatus Fluviicola riflensis]OGS85306.1 MAG: hypothetical protein A2724_11775 [Fluviicola sp. RIFCSPHIGHO2_01_FULL_43_53]OGS87348.1 MAG: hypothetical protein A3E30_08195 [Fluviicola sp. RIFCSPHIGHO2_12_FULL_43_24]